VTSHSWCQITPLTRSCIVIRNSCPPPTNTHLATPNRYS